jgi:hypothetical protein
MATHGEQTIGEHDVVAFTEAIDKTDWSDATGTWPAGTRGTVVSDYGDHKEVEISDDLGVPLDFPVVPVEQLELVSKHSNANGTLTKLREATEPDSPLRIIYSSPPHPSQFT